METGRWWSVGRSARDGSLCSLSLLSKREARHISHCTTARTSHTAHLSAPRRARGRGEAPPRTATKRRCTRGSVMVPSAAFPACILAPRPPPMQVLRFASEPPYPNCLGILYKTCSIARIRSAYTKKTTCRDPGSRLVRGASRAAPGLGNRAAAAVPDRGDSTRRRRYHRHCRH